MTLQYFAIRQVLGAIGLFFNILPEKTAYRAGVGFAMFMHNALPKYRELARKNITTAFGREKSPDEIDAILRKSYANFGKSLVEFFILPRRDAAWVEKKVIFDDPEWRIRTAMEKNKGVVSLGAHFGSWELVGARIAMYKYPFVVVVRAQRDAVFTKLIQENRSRWGLEIIVKELGVDVKEECMKQLAMNKIVALIADQNATKRGVFVDFFGKKAATVTGPAELAMRTGTPIIPGFPYRNPDDTVSLTILPPIEMDDTGDWNADILSNTQKCQTVIENFIRLHPEEYFWWHRRWRTRPPEEREAEKNKENK